MVLQDLHLQVPPRSIVALLGPNGAGKSTLLRILATLSRPSAGQVSVAGLQLPAQAAEARQQLGYLGHQPSLYGDLSAEANLHFFASLYNVAKPARRVDELLELVGLHTRRREQVRTFSRGMQQRMAIARAVLHKPRVLLLDEPHSTLDAEASAMMDRLLRGLSRKGAAVLFATHDQARAISLASRVEILAGGRLHPAGSKQASRVSARSAQLQRSADA
jgi:heme exporter protein A